MIRKGTGPAGVGDGAEKQTTGRGAAGVPSITATADLPREMRQWAIERGADAALAEGRAAAVVGIFDEHLKVCTAGCCLDEAGAYVVIPDVVAAELVANEGADADFGKPWRLRRHADQRECYVYGTPGGGSRG